jgi:hypothetical protein
MRRPLMRVAVGCALFLIVSGSLFIPDRSVAQQRNQTLVCKQPVLAAVKPMPELSYECGEQANDWDEKILKLPARLEAIKALKSELSSSFADNAWWMADAVDLSVCDFKHETGVLNADQRREFMNEYLFWLWGNDRNRLVLLRDPCYQTEYGGSNAFLLHRSGGKVFVSQVMDGYFSRADNSVNLDFAKLGTEEIVEVSTGSGGLHPTLTNYYFVVDPRTNAAVPKKLFKGDHGPTNQITSAMLFNSTSPVSEPLRIVRGKTLAPSFIVYVDNGERLSRKILRWNGNVYR